MTAIITDLTLPTGVTVSGQAITGSIAFNGSSQYLTATNAALAFGTSNFTVEAWVYTTVSSGTQCVYDTRQNDGSTTGFFFGLYGSNTLLFYTGSIITINGGTVPINTWTHIALVRVGNTFTIYLNGTSVDTATNSNNFTNTNVQIGSSSTVTSSSSNYYTGYISNIRVVNGTALYSSNFTAPNGPLSIIQSSNQNGNPSTAINLITSTSLMLNTVNNSSYLTDSSYYKNTITANASPSSSAINPFTNVMPASIQYLVVAGGGGAGYGEGTFYGGGGGGGGEVLYSSLSIPSLAGSTLAIVVGAGGTGGLVSGSTIATAGTTSSIGGITAQGGGYGFNSANGVGYPSIWAGTSGSGFLGGVGYANNGYGSAGGGDGSPGFDYNSTGRSQGGFGTLISIFDSYGTNASNSTSPSSGKGYFGGGGGAGAWYARGNSNGGRGGGGNSLNSTSTNTAGLANTGGGGGGGGSGVDGAAGGSGIVIIRYPDSYAAASATTGSPTVTYASGYRIYTFNISGSITF